MRAHLKRTEESTSARRPTARVPWPAYIRLNAADADARARVFVHPASLPKALDLAIVNMPRTYAKFDYSVSGNE